MILEQLIISSLWNVQDASSMYRMQFSGTEYFLMWRNFGYTQNITQQ